METRQITEYKIYYLTLSHVKSNVDNAHPVVAFDDLDKLITWLDSQKEYWVDNDGGADSFGSEHSYSKAYKKGSIIEWYNPPQDLVPREWPSCFGGVGYLWLADPTQSKLNVPLNPNI